MPGCFICQSRSFLMMLMSFFYFSECPYEDDEEKDPESEIITIMESDAFEEAVNDMYAEASIEDIVFPGE